MVLSAELCGWYVVDVEAGVYSLIPSFSGFSLEAPVMFNFDFSYIVNNISTFLVIMFTFLFTDIFDTVGTLIGVAEKGNLLNEKGELPRAKGALMADAVGTVVGACLVLRRLRATLSRARAFPRAAERA